MLQDDDAASGFPSNYFLVLIPVAVIACELAPLLIRQPFYLDWINHAWMIDYVRQDLKRHIFTMFFDANDASGNPSPLFYGYLFYPLMSLISALLGTDTAVRLTAAALVLGNVAAYTVFVKRYIRSGPVAFSISVVVLCSVYQLSNLYSRSALTEFFAHQMLIHSFPLFALSIRTTCTRSLTYLSAGLALLAGVLGTHPVTFYLFAIFVAPLALPFIIFLPRDRKMVIAQAALALIFAFVVSGWFVLMANYGALDIRRGITLLYFPGAIDDHIRKLFPFVSDVRPVAVGVLQTQTPFLEAPLNLAGLLAVIALLMPRREKLPVWLWYAAAVAALCLIAVVTLAPDGHPVAGPIQFFRELAAPAQFAYRLTNTFSVQCCAVLVFGLCLKTEQPASSSWTGLKAAALAISLIATCTSIFAKVTDVYAAFYFFPKYLMGVDGARLLPLGPDAKSQYAWSYAEYTEIVHRRHRYPPTFYSKTDYAMLGVFRPLGAKPGPGVTAAAIFADAEDEAVTVTCAETCAVRTDLVPSNLFTPRSNGAAIPTDAILEGPDKRIVLELPAGTHRLTYAPVPVVRLIQASRYVWLVWIVLNIAAFCWPLAAARFRRSRGRLRGLRAGL